ncbi:MAG: hypothetical protein KAJ55_03540 [Anaerolineales bacterium]|nr:hypothetical protein [Anaerolineales bacterium]
MVQQRYGSIAGGVSRSGVNIRPRVQEDAPFNPRPLAEGNFQFQSPYPPPGQRQYTAPAVLPGLEAAAPTPDFSPQPGGDAIGALPPLQMPGERIPMPTYQEPERPGKWRTALGIGLSGMANLSGQGPQAAANFFLAPEARAERDYARELGAYSARQGEWSQYYEDIMGRQSLDLERQQLEELKARPRSVPYRGSLTDPEGKLLYKDPGGMFGAGGSQWEARAMQAYNVWLQKHPEKSLATMTPADRQEAERDANRFFGDEVLVSTFEGDQVVGRYRSDAEGKPRPVQVFGPGGVSTGGFPGQRLTEERAPRARGFSDSQRANFEIEYETERTEAAFFDEAGKEAVEKKYDAIFVRGAAHNEGDVLTLERALEYIRIARAELGQEALNMSVERLAEAWAAADGYTIPQVYD